LRVSVFNTIDFRKKWGLERPYSRQIP
jgi:hypothetical protein